ncbi:MAG: helix-turn-helix domain-containing protein [Clostridia bacterium]|nr:helix-turn-helix domain-containing protein [Clostridia bacterium]
MKLNEQIAALRKKKGITQEQLAVVLGVTNQSVSKWESGQCCPDIELLPDIARYFDVSIDELMGVETAEKAEKGDNFYDEFAKMPNLSGALSIASDNGGASTSILQRRLSIGYGQAKALVEKLIALGYIEEQSEHGLHRMTIKNGIPGTLAYDMQTGFLERLKKLPFVDARKVLLGMAFSGHATYLYAKENVIANVDSAVDAVLGGQWGYSAISEPEFTTVMRGQTVLYSNNTALDFNDDRISRICDVLKDLSDRKHLAVLSALYALTVQNEAVFAAVADVAERAVMHEADVRECLKKGLRAYVCEEDGKYRIRGEQMAVVPILSILCY